MRALWVHLSTPRPPLRALQGSPLPRAQAPSPWPGFPASRLQPVLPPSPPCPHPTSCGSSLTTPGFCLVHALPRPHCSGAAAPGTRQGPCPRRVPLPRARPVQTAVWLLSHRFKACLSCHPGAYGDPSSLSQRREENTREDGSWGRGRKVETRGGREGREGEGRKQSPRRPWVGGDGPRSAAVKCMETASCLAA